jgi:ribosomal protein L11 methylase PrmA
MIEAELDSASFRDPHGQIYHLGDRVLRTVTEQGKADFEWVKNTSLFEDLTIQKKLIAADIINIIDLPENFKTAAYVLEHPRLPFVSYPYEWSFYMLQEAALLQLDVQLQALKHSVTLTDASAYNIQWQGSQPIFIDYLSFTPYKTGMLWQGHRQFYEQFLYPLLLQAYTGVACNDWYRGALEGITATTLKNLLPLHSKFLPKIFMHVLLMASLQKTSHRETTRILPKINLSASAFQHLLEQLVSWIQRLKPVRKNQTLWQSYVPDEKQQRQKLAAVARFIKSISPTTLWDIGCNTGDYAKCALQAGAKTVIGFDSDQGALDQAYLRAKAEKLAFLPLYMDFANPSPNQGWRQQERLGLSQRSPADALLALALIHHLAIVKNIPLQQLVQWLIQLAPQGLIEFVPKSDPKVQALLSLREDIFLNYNQEYFVKCIEKHASIIEIIPLIDSERSLIWYQKKENNE